MCKSLCLYVILHVLHTTAPHPPENVSASVINSTTVEVTWDPPSITNGILRYYTVVYGSSDDVEVMEVNSSDVILSGSGDDIGSGEMMAEKMNSRHVSSSGMGQGIGSGIKIGVGSISLTVSGLHPFTNYTFYVLAVTVAPSEPSDSVTVLTDEGGKKNYECIRTCIFHLEFVIFGCTAMYQCINKCTRFEQTFEASWLQMFCPTFEMVFSN